MMSNAEVNLKEELEFVRSLSTVVEPLEKIYQEVIANNQDLEGYFKEIHDFLRKYVFKLEAGLTFSHQGTTYRYRATEDFSSSDEDIADPESGYTEWKPADLVINLGECANFFETFANLSEVVSKAKQDPSNTWAKSLDMANVWERATLSDLANLDRFAKRITAEIENGGFNFEDWTEIGEVEARSGDVDLLVKNTYSHSSYVEGPQTLHFAFKEKDDDKQVNEAEQIQSVIYGIDSTDQATIYSVILDTIGEFSPGRVENAQRSVRSMILYLGIIHPDMADDKKSEYLLELFDNGKFEELNSQVISLPTFWDKKKEEYVDGLANLVDLLIREGRLKPVFAERSENLRQFNKISGGASMVSFVTTLALMKKEGINKVRIPVYLPLVQHAGFKGEELMKLYASLTNQTLSRLQSLTKFFEDIELSEDESSVIVDLSNWSMELSSENKKNRQLKSLLENIRLS